MGLCHVSLVQTILSDWIDLSLVTYITKIRSVDENEFHLETRRTQIYKRVREQYKLN